MYPVRMNIIKQLTAISIYRIPEAHFDLPYSRGSTAKILYKSNVSVTPHTCPTHGCYSDPTLS